MLVGLGPLAHVEARASVTCESLDPPRTLPLALSRGARPARIALARGPDGALWVAVRLVPGPGARRARTTILGGAVSPDGARWTAGPFELASLPGRADLPIAIAAHARGATVLIARPRATLLREIPRDGPPTESIEWGPPPRASGPPLIDAQGAIFSVLWRGPARLSLQSGDANRPVDSVPRWRHVRRAGSLGGDGLSAVVALSEQSAAVVHALRSGATRLTVIDGGTVSSRITNAAHCSDRCTLLEVRSIPRGALSLYTIPVRGERALFRHWASRITLDGTSHTTPSIPIVRALAAPGGLGRDALVQIARPLVLRGIARPVGLPLDPSIRTIPDAIATHSERDESFLVVGAHRPGALSIARARCVESR